MKQPEKDIITFQQYYRIKQAIEQAIKRKLKQREKAKVIELAKIIFREDKA